MRPVREITAKDENFRIESKTGLNVVKRDSIKPEPEGTIVLVAFRIKEYHPDCDGSLLAHMESIDSEGEITGWEVNGIGLYPSTEIVVSLEEWQKMFQKKE